MGWFGRGGGAKKEDEKSPAPEQKEEGAAPNGASEGSPASLEGQSVEVLRPQPKGPLPTDVSVFEFGSAGPDSESKMTLAGYCPVSDEMEPCRWEVLPAGSTASPGFRILF